ncbi:MAG: hypothetical protein ACI9MR_001592 [Myxococcota bacterium]
MSEATPSGSVAKQPRGGREAHFPARCLVRYAPGSTARDTMKRQRWLTGLVCTVVFATVIACGPDRSAGAAPEDGRRRLALIVAINDYGGDTTVLAADRWRPLAGTHADAAALKATLAKRGYEVKVLLDGQATHDGIVSTFRSHLVDGARAGKGDHIWFHYSGHGQQIPDDNGAPDELDGYDEALVPYDNRGSGDTAGHLRDDTLGKLLDALALKQANVVVSLDSCHSGTASRADMRWVRGDVPKHPPATKRGRGDDGISSVIAKGSVLLAASSPSQFAAEAKVGNKTMGAFTYMLTRALATAGPKTTYLEVMDQVGVQMAVLSESQTPQAEGDVKRAVFGADFQQVPAYFPVRPNVDSKGLTVEAGELHGLHPGSVLGLYPFGRGRMDRDKPAARLELTDVGLVSSTGRLIAGENAAFLVKGARAVELLAVIPPSALRIALAPEAEALRDSVGALKFITRVKSTAAYDVMIESGAAQTIALRRADGSALLFPRGHKQPLDAVVAADAPDLAKRVALALEAEYRKRRLLRMTNLDPDAALYVTMAVHRVKAKLERGQPVVTDDLGPIRGGLSAPVRVRDLVQFEFHNQGGLDAYVTVIALSPDGGIEVMLPEPGQAPEDALVKAGSTRRLPTIVVLTKPGGMQYFKLIATEHHVDFSRLTFKSGSRGDASSALAGWMAPLMDTSRAERFGSAVRDRWSASTTRFEIVE